MCVGVCEIERVKERESKRGHKQEKPNATRCCTCPAAAGAHEPQSREEERKKERKKEGREEATERERLDAGRKRATQRREAEFREGRRLNLLALSVDGATLTLRFLVVAGLLLRESQTRMILASTDALEKRKLNSYLTRRGKALFSFNELNCSSPLIISISPVELQCST
ncbi:hypothetical protein JZ751_014732 [Albula glossodonta]|uniref:Uncharacterized protein n=1 Tax=Albula glossodonta TaxID=121402 RepID=A0A8T2MXF8_9TELE|nr:hypothetical protein JZ751_014732 [Albula glossodonta]